MMLEPEKLQNRGKQGWPDAGKGIYRAQKRQESQQTRQAQMDANRAAQCLRREAETPKARPIKANVCQHSFQIMLSSVLLRSLHEELSIMRMGCSHCYTCTSSCMRSGGAHGPSHILLQEMVYKQRLLQLAQARPTMPAFISIVTRCETA